jgi:ABC-type uncharacterized transport system permease subunit
VEKTQWQNIFYVLKKYTSKTGQYGAFSTWLIWHVTSLCWLILNFCLLSFSSLHLLKTFIQLVIMAMIVIPATQVAETRRSWFEASPTKSARPHLKKQLKTKRPGLWLEGLSTCLASTRPEFKSTIATVFSCAEKFKF